MQKLSPELQFVSPFATVDAIPYHRMPDEIEMNADLVCATGLRFDLQQSIIPEPFSYSEDGNRLSRTCGGDDGEAFAIVRIAAEWRFDPALRDINHPIHQREIGFVYRPGRELPL